MLKKKFCVKLSKMVFYLIKYRRVRNKRVLFVLSFNGKYWFEFFFLWNENEDFYVFFKDVRNDYKCI